MNIELLIEEGLRLSKPCVYLTESGTDAGEVQSVWGGTGVIEPPEAGGLKHRVTVSGALLQSLGFRFQGSLSVYEVEDESDWIAIVGPSVHLSQSGSDGIPLFGKPMPSFPPLEAVCLYGNAEIELWLKSQGLSRHEAEALYGTSLGEAYEKKYQQQSPLYAGTADVVLGGWHMMWPEDDAYDEHEGDLILWTFRDAEPWLEVWLSGQRLNVKARIT